MIIFGLRTRGVGNILSCVRSNMQQFGVLLYPSQTLKTELLVVIHFDSPFVAKFVRDEDIESTSFVAGACFTVNELMFIESSVVLSAVLFLLISVVNGSLIANA